MPERGRSPGAKGTAYPRAQRPQKPTRPSGVPPAFAKPTPAGARPPRLPHGDSLRSPHGDSLRSQKSGGVAALGKPAPAAPVDPDAPVRVSKLLAERGLCSRREADSYIERGWVLVDGQRITELGVKAKRDARITLAPEARSQQARQVTILLNKPVGYVSGQPEPGFEPAVALVTADNQQRGAGDPPFERHHLRGLAPAGRLDIDSTGLLVLTQDGRVARQLIGENSTVEKEYLVRVEGDLITDGLRLLNHGLALDGKPLRPAKVEWLNDDQLRFVLREGKKRQIRRMCELVGLKVIGLKRVRMGRLRLGDLPPGRWRYLRPDEGF